MKRLIMLFLIMLGLIGNAAIAIAQDLDWRQCQSLAQDFASYPEEMSLEDLRTLRQCVNQELVKRGDSEAATPSEGAATELQSSSAGNSDGTPPQAPRNLGVVK